LRPAFASAHTDKGMSPSYHGELKCHHHTPRAVNTSCGLSVAGLTFWTGQGEETFISSIKNFHAERKIMQNFLSYT